MSKENNRNRSRSWIVTQSAEKISPEDLQKALSPYTYIGQLEQGEKGGEQGYKHFQIYIENPTQISFSTLKKLLPNCHLERRRGTKQEAYDYVTKSETRIGEPFGNGEIDLTEIQGRRTDLLKITEMLDNGATEQDIRRAYPTQFLTMKTKIREYIQSLKEEQFKNARRLNLEVTYIYGKTGTGKTRFVLDKYGDENVFRMTRYGKREDEERFDGYTGQSIIVFEEFRSHISISNMLNYLDIYGVSLPARYGDKTACYDKVFIISNWQLNEQYKNIQTEHPETFKAFLRRIHYIWEYDKQVSPQPLTKPQQTIMTLQPLPKEEADELGF